MFQESQAGHVAPLQESQATFNVAGEPLRIALWGNLYPNFILTDSILFIS